MSYGLNSDGKMNEKFLEWIYIRSDVSNFRNSHLFGSIYPRDLDFVITPVSIVSECWKNTENLEQHFIFNRTLLFVMFQNIPLIAFRFPLFFFF